MVKEKMSFKLLEQYPNAIKSEPLAVGDVVFGRNRGEAIRRGYVVSKVYFKSKRGSKILVINAESPILSRSNHVSLVGVPAFEFAKLEK